MHSLGIFRVIVAALCVPLLCIPARAASPTLSSVMPRGGQRGTEVDLVLAGDRLTDAQEVLFYQPGLTVKTLQPTTQQVKVRVAIAADAPLGERSLRLRTASGISELRTFWVGALPTVDEKEPNTDFAQPQKGAMNVTVAGTIDNEDVDYIAVQAQKGQRLTAEVEGLRLGETMFDPYLAILDADRAEAAACDDSALLLQDPVVSIIAPKDGTYIIQIRDSAYGGSASSHYRLHIGTFPRPRIVYPLGGQVGTELAAQFLGDVSGPIAQTLRLPPNPIADHHVFVDQAGQVTPSPNHVRVSNFANILEAEPNNDANAANAITGEFPLALNGIVATKGDVDLFKFKAKKDQVFDLNVYARRLRSGLDSVLSVCDAAGNIIATNDDTGGPDSYLRFTVPADGEYCIRITDQLSSGAPDYAYRIEVTPVQAKLALAVPLVAANSQERQTIVVPRGNRVATLMRATRADFASDVQVSVNDLPAGVTFNAEPVAAALDVVPIVFEAAADAPIAGKLCSVVGAPVDPKLAVPSDFSQAADLIVFGNQVAFYQAKVSKLAVAVAEEVPFRLSIVQPKVPLVASGSMQLKVIAERKAGFVAPINIAMPFNPPGVGSGPATIAANANETIVPLNASGDAAARKWKICVVGSSDAGGTVWVSSQLAELEIAPPFLTGKLEMAAAEQGKATQMLCTIEQKAAFEGQAKVQLLGLPPNTTATERPISSADTKVVFDVQTDAKSPPGQHNSLFCAVTVLKNGEPILHSIAAGGVLRIDPASPTVPAAVAPPAPTTAPAAPVSRLQQLRLEQAARTVPP